MPDFSLIGTGLISAVVLWFIFTVVRKLFVLALMIALVIDA